MGVTPVGTVTFNASGSNAATVSYTVNGVSANYSASGRFGSLGGNGTCSDGVNFTFSASDVALSRDALSVRIAFMRNGGCRFDGRMGGIREGAL